MGMPQPLEHLVRAWRRAKVKKSLFETEGTQGSRVPNKMILLWNDGDENLLNGRNEVWVFGQQDLGEDPFIMLNKITYFGGQLTKQCKRQAKVCTSRLVQPNISPKMDILTIAKLP